MGGESSRYGMPAHYWDIRYGNDYDLGSWPVVKRIVKEAKRGRLQCAMIAICCAPWSIARNRTNVIRSRLEPFGLSVPHKVFSANDMASLALGNRQARCLVYMRNEFNKLKIPVIVENPQSSYLWAVPGLQKLLLLPTTQLV